MNCKRCVENCGIHTKKGVTKQLVERVWMYRDTVRCCHNAYVTIQKLLHDMPADSSPSHMLAEFIFLASAHVGEDRLSCLSRVFVGLGYMATSGLDVEKILIRGVYDARDMPVFKREISAVICTDLVDVVIAYVGLMRF